MHLIHINKYFIFWKWFLSKFCIPQGMQVKQVKQVKKRVVKSLPHTQWRIISGLIKLLLPTVEPLARQFSCFTVQSFVSALHYFQWKAFFHTGTLCTIECSANAFKQHRGIGFIVHAENISFSFGLRLVLFKVKSVQACALLGCILMITDLYLSSLMESKLCEDPALNKLS